ncbi:MAG: hypothetical protein M3P98_04530 [bacterium]|nr:hypothetical protein [bacterium]
MKIQETSSLNQLLDGEIGRSPNIRLVTLFRMCRSDERVSYFGDYPLISNNLAKLNCLGRTVSRWEIRTALNNSMEFAELAKGEKSELLDRLYKVSIGQL